MKKLLLLSALFAVSTALLAQNTKKNPPKPGPASNPEIRKHALKSSQSVPAAIDMFDLGEVNYQPLQTFQPDVQEQHRLRITRDKNGRPIFFQGKTAASGTADDPRPAAERALAYLASVAPEGVKNPAAEFVVSSASVDEQGNHHVRFRQVSGSVPVYGAELIAHSKNGVFQLLNGRYFPSTQLGSLTPALDAVRAVEKVKEHIGTDRLKTSWTPQELAWIGGAPFSTELVVYHPGNASETEVLAWHIVAFPNLLQRTVYFIDAQTGAVIHHYDHTCDAVGHHAHNEPEVLAGPVTASGLDLLNVNRSFGAWQDGSVVYMEDASKPMFNNNESNMPGDPVGVIVTLDALNTSPENQNFDYTIVFSNSTSFNNKKAVSAHWNAIKSYDYFKNTFNRNSIDGVGGNILSFVNVSEGNGASMENAFWNGAAMWYGNGGSTFKELARGLDVGGHEMTHGVVEKTANLEYQDESGALNESFADVFGALIDNDDWKIGEDVVQPGVSPNGCLRDLQDPNNNAPQSSSWWQPKHVDEQYTGNQDNGGVHINSGIPNHAFYRFASNASVGRNKAEQVYYKALRDYLVKSSQFIDCRLAVIQAATDLYGANVANIAASAFDAVGIVGSQPGGNYLGQLNTNPGTEYVLCVSDDYQNLDIAEANGNVFGTLYDQGLNSRPSVSDNGTKVVFVNADGDIILQTLSYNGSQVVLQSEEALSNDGSWRNAAISKNGRFLAALAGVEEKYIYVYDFQNQLNGEAFRLYNPTYSQGQVTGEVRYADVLEFDYTGRYVMYDAYNELSNNQGEDISYWDIGFLEFWKNNAFADGENAFISKLFNGLPENTGVSDPAFAKNSPFVIAFDFIDYYENRVDIYGANLETGDYGIIVPDNGDLGWPSYNKSDNSLMFQTPTFFGADLYKQGLAPSKIAPQGNPAPFIESHLWGALYANGTRSLQVNADNPVQVWEVNAGPNPVVDRLNVQFESGASVQASVAVYSLTGVLVQSWQQDIPEGKSTLDVSFEGLPAGTYMLRIAAGKATSSIKIVRL